jgi:hypothetical protein
MHGRAYVNGVYDIEWNLYLKRSKSIFQMVKYYWKISRMNGYRFCLRRRSAAIKTCDLYL